MNDLTYEFEMKLVFIRLNLRKFRNSLLKIRIKLSATRLKGGELRGERKVLMFEKRASLLGSNGGGISFSFNGFEIGEKVSNVGICLLHHRRSVAGDFDALEFVVGEK